MQARISLTVKSGSKQDVTREVHRLTEQLNGSVTKLDYPYGNIDVVVRVEMPSGESLRRLAQGLQEIPYVFSVRS